MKNPLKLGTYTERNGRALYYYKPRLFIVCSIEFLQNSERLSYWSSRKSRLWTDGDNYAHKFGTFGAALNYFHKLESVDQAEKS